MTVSWIFNILHSPTRNSRFCYSSSPLSFSDCGTCASWIRVFPACPAFAVQLCLQPCHVSCSSNIPVLSLLPTPFCSGPHPQYWPQPLSCCPVQTCYHQWHHWAENVQSGSESSWAELTAMPSGQASRTSQAGENSQIRIRYFSMQ